MVKKEHQGFSLIELSIVILIASIFASSMINILGKKTLVDKNTETQEKMARIGEALKVYWETDGRHFLPCPAALADAPAAVKLGFGETVSGCKNYTDEDKVNSTHVYSGAVPVIELGLPPQYMLDSWGNKITYIIDKDLSDKDNPWDDDTVSNIVIRDRNDKDFITRLPLQSELGNEYTVCSGANLDVSNYSVAIPDCPAFLLISHGANGYLSFNIASSQKTSSFGTTDFQTHNTPGTGSSPESFDNIFYSLPINQDTKMASLNTSNYFDDILYYKSMYYFTGTTPSAGTIIP